MKIALLLPTLTQPRFHKRIDSLSKITEDIEVYGFDRGFYKENTLSAKNVTVLGSMDNKNYLKRFSVYFKLASLIWKRRNSLDLFYFFTIDFAILGFLLLPKGKYVYEIGDFAYLGLRKSLVKILTSFDLHIIKKSLFTVLTSHGFERYLRNKQRFDSKKFVVIPNKVNSQLEDYPRSMRIAGGERIRFGFVGVLRYPKTIFRFVRIIGEKFPQHSFVFYGDGGLKQEFLELCKIHDNLEYGGAFKNPDDLSTIYNNFDVHLACYDIGGLNQKLAEPNKFYESVYFGTPIIASKDSYFGDRVTEMNVGYCIDASTDENVINVINSLNSSELNRVRKSMLVIPSSQLIDSDKEFLARFLKVKL